MKNVKKRNLISMAVFDIGATAALTFYWVLRFYQFNPFYNYHRWDIDIIVRLGIPMYNVVQVAIAMLFLTFAFVVYYSVIMSRIKQINSSVRIGLISFAVLNGAMVAVMILWRTVGYPQVMPISRVFVDIIDSAIAGIALGALLGRIISIKQWEHKTNSRIYLFWNKWRPYLAREEK